MNFQAHYNPSIADARPVGALEVDPDIDRALDGLRRSFPGLCIWHGEFSGSLWALLPDRLVEAKTAADLARQLYGILGLPRPRAARPPSAPSIRRPDGTWNVSARAPVRRAARMSAWPVPLL
jgi:hypothetical protein